MRDGARQLADLCGPDDNDWFHVASRLLANAEGLEMAAGRVERMAKGFGRWSRMAMKAGALPDNAVQAFLPGAEDWTPAVIEGGKIENISNPVSERMAGDAA